MSLAQGYRGPSKAAVFVDFERWYDAKRACEFCR